MHRLQRVVAIAFVAATLTLAVALSTARPAFALTCGGTAHAFAGNHAPHTNAVRGAKALIQYELEALCTTSGVADSSSYWVGVIGKTFDGSLDIYQIGIDKCRYSACPAGNPVNQPYYFWAYGRNASTACGAAVDPEPVSLGLASGSDRTYKVVRELLTGAGFFYNLYIDSTPYRQWLRPESDLQTCWGGVNDAQFLNEVIDANAESGGTTAFPQHWSSVYWYTGSAWTSVTGATGSNCWAHDLSTQRCVWDSFDPSRWTSWDTRY